MADDALQIDPHTGPGAPDPVESCRQIINSMLSADPVPGIGFAVHSRSDGRPLVTVAVAIGYHAAGALRDAAKALSRTYPDSELAGELSQSESQAPVPDSPPQP